MLQGWSSLLSSLSRDYHGVSKAELPPILLMCKFGSPFPTLLQVNLHSKTQFMLFYLYSTQQLFSKVPANRSVGEDHKLSLTSAACLRRLGGASASSAPPEGRWGRRTAKSTLRELNLDLVENLKQTFPERRAGENHKSTYAAWPPAVPLQPCPQGKGCLATSTLCSEP